MRRANALARLLVFSLLLAGAAAGPVRADSWAQFLVHPAMRVLGLKEGSATLESLATDRVVLRDVRLSPELTAERVEVTFDPLQVLRGRVEAVRIQGARAHIAFGPNGGIHIRGLPEPKPAPMPDGAEAPPGRMVFPLQSLLLEDARLTLDVPGLPGGPVRAEATLRARFAAGIQATGALALHHGGAEARLALAEARARQDAEGAWQVALNGALDAQGGGVAAAGPLTLKASAGEAVKAALAWQPAQASLPDGMTLAGLSLKAEVGVSPGQDPVIIATLAANQAAGDGWQVAHPQIRVSGTPSDVRLAISTAAQDKPLNVRVERGPGIRINANGAVVIDWLTPILRAAGLPLHGSGEAVVLLSLRLPEGPLTDPATLDSADADGLVSLALKDIRWGELAAADTVDGRLTLNAAANTGRIRAPEGLRVTGLNLSEAIRNRLPPLLAPLLAEPVFAAYGGPELGSPEIGLKRTSDGSIQAESTLALRLGNPAFGLLAEGKLQATLPAEGPPRLTSEALTLRLVDTALGAMRASGEFAIADLDATPESLSATVTLAARTKGSPDPAVQFAQADLDATVGLDWQTKQLTVDLHPGSRARLLGLSGRTVRLTSPTVLQLAGERDQRLTVDLTEGDIAGGLRFRRVSGAFTAREAGHDAQSAAFDLDGLRIDLAPDSYRLRIADGAVRVPNLSLVADRLRAEVRLGRNGADDGGRLVVGRIRHAADRPAVVPLRLQLDLADRGEALGFTGRLTDLERRIAFTVEGAHNLTTGTGHARFFAPLLFLPDVLQPAQLFPAAANLILDTNAAITLNANASWSPKGLTQRGKLSLSFDHMDTAELSLRGAVAEVELASLVPPATAGPQRITISRLDVGVPLTLGIVSLDMRSLQDIRLHLEQFDLFGGQVRAEPLRLNAETLSFATVLEVDGIDLSQALRFADFGEFWAEGRLAGRIPIVAQGGEMLVQGARLETQTPGRLRYRPVAISDALEDANEATDLVVQALKDFRYERFVIELDEQDAEDLMIRLHFAGQSANPLTRGGITLDPMPIEININLEGPMRQILNDAVDDTSDITSYSWTEQGS